VLNADTVQAKPDGGTVEELLANRDELETEAEAYISNIIRQIQAEVREEKHDRVESERADLEAYAAAERDRIETFIENYEQRAESGDDMELSIRNQQQRLDRLEERIEDRKAELDRREQVVSLAPELEGWCLTLGV